ncbi:radical SAM protein [Desulfogranum marinum]|uniref:radical SAM protein n=1 Tax=Desulfogranum marinum TaxID=453220 RepID=UPI0029C69D24|nr:radical SAM protein [Desulfogranum marinum]
MRSQHPKELPFLVFANSKGEIEEYEGLQMAAQSAANYCKPNLEDLIELPEGSELFTLPGRLPVGIEKESGEPALLDTDPYDGTGTVQAVAAFMAPAYTSLYTTAYQTQDQHSPQLPLFAYTAVGWYDGKFWVTGFRSDRDKRQDTANFDQDLITLRTRKKLQQHPHNRLIQHLGKCCLTYCCPAARNFFLNRWEAPLPCSPVCNATCVGCISLQPSGCCASTQDRITFVPTVKEVSEIAIEHLTTAPLPIVSFGQGCEGEPLLQADLMERSIKAIRKATSKGTINLNTNGSLPDAVERLAKAGLDSIRISMNSAQLEKHTLYYRPKGFTLKDVEHSIQIMKRYQRHVSLNYFIFPGFTDDPDELAALSALIDKCHPDFIQLRNLNIDPEVYLRAIQHQPTQAPLGIRNWLGQLQTAHPDLQFGYFNPQVKK